MKSQNGFTLIEMMITIAVFSLIISAAFATHIAQQKTYSVQDQVTEMQQNMRAAMFFIGSELRMAGYDPEGTANAGLTTALPGRLRFTKDTDEDGALGGTDEMVDIGFSPTVDATGNGIPDADSDGDGVPDAVAIGRQIDGAGGYQNIAENIQALEFLYLDIDGNVTATAGDVCSVRISMLARSSRPDPDFTNAIIYTTPSGQVWGPYNDNYRRRLLTTTIRCRNLGI